MTIRSCASSAVRGALIGAALAVPIAPSDLASARTQSALLGNPDVQTDPLSAPCIDFLTFGTVTNTCVPAQMAGWQMPLVIDAPGYYNPQVTITAAGPESTVTCTAFGYPGGEAYDSHTFWASATASNTPPPSSSGGLVTETLSLAGLYVPYGGFGVVECGLDFLATLQAVTY